MQIKIAKITSMDEAPSRVTRANPFGGESTMELNIDPKTLTLALVRMNKGAFVQDALPQLTADEREFLITGLTPKQFAEVYGEENYGD